MSTLSATRIEAPGENCVPRGDPELRRGPNLGPDFNFALDDSAQARP